MAIEPGRGGGGGAVGAKSQRLGEDRFLALPEELQEEILTRLPVKDAIRTGALARGWRNLWKRRWTKHNGSIELHGSVELHGSRDALRTELEAREARLKRNPGYRIDRFSLVAETKLLAKELGRFNNYAAHCRVGDLHVESPISSRSKMLSFPVPRSSEDLEHLSLRHFRMSDMYYNPKRPRKFRALEGAYSLPDGGASAQLPDLSLPKLTELQLLMFGLEAVNLSDFYVFLKTRQCPNLEKLFVQLPASVSKPLEGSADELGEEPPEIGLDKLVMVKVMNFNWGHAEVQLVRFLLSKATSLRELFLVPPNVNSLDFPIEQDEVLKKALEDGKILLHDDAATRPNHSEVLIKL